MFERVYDEDQSNHSTEESENKRTQMLKVYREWVMHVSERCWRVSGLSRFDPWTSRGDIYEGL